MIKELHSFAFLLFSCLILAFPVQAQSDVDMQLAQSYLKQGEFDKARLYYEDFYNQKPTLAFALALFNCYVELEDYKSAEKLMKKQQKKHPNNLVLGIELGRMFKRSGNIKKAHNEWDNVVSNTPAQQGEIIRIARKFSAIPEYEYALKIYEKGKKELNNFYAFNFEIADIYGLMGKQDQMIDMYLEMLDYNPGYMQTVQNLLARNIDFEEDTEAMELLRTRLLKFIQQQPEQQLYPELLIWLYIQQRDFYGAFTQVKALDRRFNEDGFRLMGMAEMAESNQAFEVAATAYEAVVKKGPETPYYVEAKLAMLRTRKKKLEITANTPLSEYQELAISYQSTIQEINFLPTTAVAQRELAAILAQQLNQKDSALTLLNELIELPSVSNKFKAECQIDAGDYLVMNNQIWDAAIEYLKAEKAFKYDNIGEQAKFKAAKVYYYTGEFGFAKGMLDVLKGSTSRLIANDALYLSQLILDNTTIDTSEVAMQLFAKADLYFNQQRYADAQLVLDSILTQFPEHRITDDVYFMRYKIFAKTKDYQRAAEALELIVAEYPTDLLGDDAVFLLGKLNEEEFQNKEAAMSFFEKILTDYPASLYVVESRKRYRTLRGDTIQ